MVDCRYSSEVNKTILNMCAGSLMFPCKVKEVADWNIVENNCKTSCTYTKKTILRPFSKFRDINVNDWLSSWRENWGNLFSMCLFFNWRERIPQCTKLLSV